MNPENLSSLLRCYLSEGTYREEDHEEPYGCTRIYHERVHVVVNTAIRHNHGVLKSQDGEKSIEEVDGSQGFQSPARASLHSHEIHHRHGHAVRRVYCRRYGRYETVGVFVAAVYHHDYRHNERDIHEEEKDMGESIHSHPHLLFLLSPFRHDKDCPYYKENKIVNYRHPKGVSASCFTDES